MESFNNYNYLSFFNPYYLLKKEKIVLKDNISKAIKTKDVDVILDEVSIIEILTKNYILGDRTLIKGINKTPWMAKPDKGSTRWNYFKELKFDNKELDKTKIANKFFSLLKEEMTNYIGDKKSIGILLSGGMDSRMIAGVLDSLIKEKAININKVIAFTWGNRNSRDVIYAKKIAKRLGWELKHFELTPNDLICNIEETAKRGCEYSPTNLHAMIKVRDERGIDCVLAGSFGDSIGRGEYSGKKVMELVDLRENINNRFGFFKKGIINNYKDSIDYDIETYHELFPQKEKYQQIEQDYQIHYWRRMLNPCMSVINEKTPLFQLFTSPKLVMFIWSLQPSFRNNDIYKELLNKFSTDLSDIPWARTGLKYGETTGTPDSYTSSHSSYSKFINEDLYDEIKDLALSKNITQLNIFNIKAIENTFKVMKSSNYIRDTRVETHLFWLASLSKFIDIYKVDIKSSENSKNYFSDYLNTFIPLKNNMVNIGKDYYRKIFK